MEADSGLIVPSEVRRHIETVYGPTIDAGLRVLVCTKKNFAGQWFDSVEAAVEAAVAVAEDSDVYVGLGSRSTPPPPDKRGTADEIESIPGMWADIDIADSVHKKKGLLATFEDARKFVLDLFPMHPPTMVVFSGHGLQVYWLFPEPWIFDDEADRKKAAAFSERFAATVKAFARTRSVVVDSVFDLSRVFRLAGTVNRKATPVPVRFLSPINSNRYPVDELEGLLIAEEFVPDSTGKSRATFGCGYLELSPGRNPPQDALIALLTNHEKAKATWEGNRPDLADQSASTYDFSLAVIAARHGWTDQEIADLLIARRRKRGDDLKTTKKGAIRLDYYQRTIATARRKVEEEKRSRPYAEDETVALVGPNGKPTSDDARKKILERLRRIFDLEIERFVQQGSADEAIFSFELSDGTSIPIGTAKDLDSQATMRSKIFPIAHRVPKRLKLDEWDRMLAELGSIVEIVDNPESTRSGKFAALLTEYLAAKAGSIREKDVSKSISQGDPFLRDGRLFVCTTSIESFVRFSYTRKVESRDLWTDLPAWKFKPEKVSARVGVRKIARRYWSVPIDDLTANEEILIPFVFGTEIPGSAEALEARGSATGDSTGKATAGNGSGRGGGGGGTGDPRKDPRGHGGNGVRPPEGGGADAYDGDLPV